MLAEIGFLEKHLLQMVWSLPSCGERNETEIANVAFLILHLGNLKRQNIEVASKCY